MRQRKQNFLQGTVILAAGTVLVKILGALFKIPLTNRIGEVGISYFNTAYQLYLPIYTLATAGLPVAVSRTVAENVAAGRIRRVKQLRRMLTPLFLISGALGTALMWFGAEAYTQAVHSAGAVTAIRVLAPTVLFCTAMSALRGYYAGLHDLIPTAVSQVIEALLKLSLGMLGAEAVLRWGMPCYERTGTVFGVPAANASAARELLLPMASGASILGVTVGAAAGWIYLLCYAKRRGDGLPPADETELLPKRRTQLRALLEIAVPVCLGATVVNIGGLIDAALLQNRLSLIPAAELRKRITASVSDGLLPTYLYGCYTMAQTVAALLPTVSQSVSVSALPGITAVWIRGKRDALAEAIGNVLRISSILAFPCGFGLYFCAEPILRLLYAGRAEGVAIAAPALQLLGLAAIGMSLSAAVNSMLQAVGRADIPVKLLLVGMSVKITADAVLCRIPQIHLLGACVGSLLCYGILAVGGLGCLLHITKVRLCWRNTLIFPAGAGLLCGITAGQIQELTSHTVLSVAVGGTVYAAALLLTKTVSAKDLQNLFGRKTRHLKSRKKCDTIRSK